MGYRLVALDIDGTLYNDAKAISERTRAAVVAVERLGVTVALASGRPPSGLAPIAQAIELDRYHGLFVAYNGGRVIEAGSGAVLCDEAVPAELARRILARARFLDLSVIVDDGRDVVTDDPEGYRVRAEAKAVHLGLRIVDDLAAVLDFSPGKILITAPPEKLAAALPAMRAPFAGEIDFAFSSPIYLEANRAGVSKGAALAHVSDRLGIGRDEVMAFGDADNDATMLAFAGLGIAMANATPAIRGIADEVTASNNDDGIAHALARHFGIAVS